MSLIITWGQKLIYSHLRNLGRGLFFFEKTLFNENHYCELSSCPFALWIGSLCSQCKCGGHYGLHFPDAIITALLGKYRPFCTELVAYSVLWSDWPINLIWCLYEYYKGLDGPVFPHIVFISCIQGIQISHIMRMQNTGELRHTFKIPVHPALNDTHKDIISNL
jgi:hypothetical protein